MIDVTPQRRPRLRLINPNSPLSTITMPGVIQHMTFSRKALFAPTGLMICAAVTPDHWDVEVVDECTLDAPHEPRADVEMVGISAMTTQAPRAYALADAYRALGVTVVLGGIHPSALPDEALQHADVVCKGDAESTLPHVIADWEAARGHAADAYAKRPQRRVYDWTDFPTAPIATPRKDVLNPRDYIVANPIQTTRGCPHDCHFCTTPAIFGRKFRLRDINSIVDEIRTAQEQHRAWCYIFADDNFGGNQKWALELCEALKPLKIAWASQCDILIARNDKLLKAMRDSGCQGVILGLESPKQDALANAGKRFTKAAGYEAAIRKIRAAGISLWGSFIFGFDTDTWEDCRATCAFAERTKLAMSCYPVLTPYPGTRFYEQFEREGRIHTRDWAKYNGASVVFEPKQMTAKELRHAQMAAFAKFFSPWSSFNRLGPSQKRAWIANLAAWRGIRYYYGKKGRQVPRFTDFLDPHARAWNYPNEAWQQPSTTMSDECVDESAQLQEAIALETLVRSEPYVQAGAALRPTHQN